MCVTVVISRSHECDIRADFEDRLAKLCAENPALELVLTPDLYHLPEHSDIRIQLASISRHIIFLSWLHPRPAEWLLRKHGIGGGGITAINMGAFAGAEECFVEVVGRAGGRGSETPGFCSGRERISRPIEGGGVTPRWYPIVDRSRCTDCGHCLQFCLFGVYEQHPEGRVIVASPDNCKPGCPACSRICPQGAIIFPLYEKDDAVAGAPGKFMSPDDAAIRMFEERTKRPHSPPAQDDDIDALIDDLDRIARRS